MAHGLDVLGFGAVAVDDILYVDRPLRAGKGKVTGRMTDHGGNVATALVAVARLGGRAGFVGWLCDQPDLDPAASELLRQGVNVSHAPLNPAARAIRSVITVGPDGDRFIAYDDDVLHGTDGDLPEAVLALAPVLLIDGYATHAVSVVARARRLGLAIVADIEWSVGAATKEVMALADHLVVPLAFGQSHSKVQDISTILAALWSEDRAAVVLTDGENGSYLRQRGDPASWHIPAYPVQAVDTTGAGDCFHGAYAFSLSQGKSPLDCARFATAAAGLSVMGPGGRQSLPGLQSCSEWLARTDAPVPVPLPMPHRPT